MFYVIVVKTHNAGTSGISGHLSFTTGTTSSGSSGTLNIATGEAKATGKGGDIIFSVSPGL